MITTLVMSKHTAALADLGNFMELLKAPPPLKIELVVWVMLGPDMPTVTALPYSFLKIMKINGAFQKYG